MGRFLGVLLFSTSLVHAQGTASVTGSVVDPSGAAVPAATVNLLLHGGKKALVSTHTGSSGLFSMESVRPETYDLVIEAAGFQTYKLANVTVNSARATDLSTIKLALATAASSVDVTANVETVQTTGPEISTTVTMDQIRRLPVADRNPLAFLSTQAGVAHTQQATVVNGQRESFSTMTLDGVSIQDNYLRDNDLDFTPNLVFLDQVQEVTITTSLSGSAASGGSQVSFVTPSGTNQFHGNALWQNRNNYFAANDFFDNKEGNGLPRLNRNNMGGSLGGPIKHDKLFFYVNTEFSSLRNQTLENATILTASARAGIFKYVDTSGKVQSIDVLKATGFTSNPVTAALLAQVPGPEKVNNFLVGDSHQGQLLNTAGYGYLVRNNQDWKNMTGKLDYNLSTKNAIAATFAWNRNIVDRPDAAVDYSTTPPYQNNNDVKFAALSWRWSPSGSLTNELRGGLNYAPATFSTTQALPSYFIGGLIYSTPVAAATFLPQGRDTRTRSFQDNGTWVRGSHTIQFGYQYQGVRIRSYDYALTVPEYDVSDPSCACVDSASQSKLLGSSQLPGIGSQDLTNANQLLASLAGLLNDDAVAYNVKNRTSGFVPGAPWLRNFQYDNHALYAQDRWKVLKHLMLTLGVRWDYYTTVNEADSLELQTVVTNNNPVGSLLSPNGTLGFTGNSVGTPFYHKDLANWAPNGGIAWDVFGDGKTSIRAGYSIHYVDDQIVEVADGYTFDNPGLQAYPANFNLSGVLGATPPAIQVPPFQVPTSFATQYALNPTSSFTLLDPHLRTPYDQQFALSIQHEFKGTIIEARYVGSHAVKMLRGFDVNQEDVTSNGFLTEFLKAQSNGNLALAATGTFNPAFNARLPGSQALNLFRQLPSGGSLSDPTNQSLIQNGEVAELAYQYTINGQNGKLNFFPNPNALSTIYLTNYSSSKYNSAQFEVRRRLQAGLEFQVNYSFSKWLSDAGGVDPFRFQPFLDIHNTGLEYARTPTDLTHQFKANYAYDLPIGGAHAIHLRKGWNRLLTGWTTSGNLSWISGNPFSINSSLGTFLREDYSGTNEADSTLTKPQLDNILQFRMTPNGPYMVPASAIGPDGRGVSAALQPFTGQVFTNPPAGTIGTLQRDQFTGPPIFEMDVALFKDNKLTERISMELRMEALNVFNHPGFVVSSSNMDVNSQQFGQIMQQANTPRELQFGLRLKF